jgi:hypothetical protein
VLRLTRIFAPCLGGGQAALEEAAFGLVADQGECCAIGVCGFLVATEATEHIGACRCQQVRGGERAVSRQRVQQAQARGWPIDHGHCDRVVEPHHRRRVQRVASGVQGGDLRPVGVWG